MSHQSPSPTKTKIITTAQTLFAQQGFDATSIEQLAQTAQITKSLIYYYFRSKEEILAAIFQNFIAQSITIRNKVQATLQSQKQAPDLEQLLKEFILPFLMEHKDVIKITFTESLKESPTTPHLNIFRYFDQGLKDGLDFSLALKNKFTPQLYNLGSFFLFWAPLFSFVILSDEWCEHYHCELSVTTDLFVQVYKILFSSFIGPITNNSINNLNI